MASPTLKSPINTRFAETRHSLSVPEVAPDEISYKAAAILVVLLVTFVLLQGLIPLRSAIKIGADEDFELAKATLWLKGYHFYTEVWNDQPLLHTFLITQVLKHLSPSVLGQRLVTSAFAVLLLTGVFFISVRVSSLLVAVFTTALLVASPGFLELSSSCMVEIPGLAPAVAGLCVLMMGRMTQWHVAEILAGVLFAVALQIKFVGAIYLSIAGLIFWLRHCGTASPLIRPSSSLSSGQTTGEVRGRGAATMLRLFPSNLIWSVLYFAVSLGFSFFAIHLLIGEGSFWLQLKQSWASHFTAAKSFEYGSPSDHPFEWSIFLKNWDTTLPAILGISFILREIFPALRSPGRMNMCQKPPSLRRSPPLAGERMPEGRERGHLGSRGKRALVIVLLAWFALDLMVFGIHKPWWSYYYVHNAIPLCWCAAIGLEAAWEKANPRRTPALFALVAVYALCAGTWMVSRIYLQASGIRHSPQIYSSLVLTEIERFKPFTKFIYTDEPIYSFHTGIPVPPRLGIIPLKRLWSGDMTNEKIAAELWTSKPEVILLANNARAVPFDDLLAAEYRPVYQDYKHRLYAQKAVIAQVKY